MPRSEHTNNGHEQISVPTYPYKTANGSTVLNMGLRFLQLSTFITPFSLSDGTLFVPCRYTCPSLRTSPLVIVTVNQILTPPCGPH